MARTHIIFSSVLIAAIISFGFVSTDKIFIEYNNPDACGIFCKMGINYVDYLRDRSFDGYWMKKSFGSFFVHLVFLTFEIPLTPRPFNLGLEIFNAAALAGAFFFWLRLARWFAFSPRQFWLGFLLLFPLHIFLKLTPYHQELPDNLAFFASFAFLNFFVKRVPVALFVIFFATLFTQPQLAIVMMPMLLLCDAGEERYTPPAVVQNILAAVDRLLERIIAAKLEAKLLAGIFLLIFVSCAYVLPIWIQPYFGSKHTIWIATPVSIALGTAIMAYGLHRLRLVPVVRAFFGSFTRKSVFQRLVIVASLYLVHLLIVRYFAQGPVLAPFSNIFGTLHVLYTFNFYVVEMPLKPWLMHLLFYGPSILFIAWRWNDLYDASMRHDLGTGFVLSLAVVFAISTDSESRHFIGFLPWFVIVSLLTLPAVGNALLLYSVVGTVVAGRAFVDYAGLSTDNDPWLLTMGPWLTQDLYYRAAAVGAIALCLFIVAVWFDRRRFDSTAPS